MHALFALAALAACALVRGYEHGNVAVMPQTCKQKLDDLYSRYYYSAEVLPGTQNCTDIIQSTLANSNGLNCLPADDVRGCFNVSS